MDVKKVLNKIDSGEDVIGGLDELDYLYGTSIEPYDEARELELLEEGDPITGAVLEERMEE